MAKKRIFDLPETRGTFHVIGQATRLNSDKSFNSGTTKNGKVYSTINFGVKYNEVDAPVSMQLTGYVNNEVYFWSSKEKQTKRIPWDERYNFKEDGYVMMGKFLSLEKDSSGKAVKPTVCPDYDAVNEIHDKLNDEDFVYIAGELNYRPYTNKDGEKRTSISLIPGRVYLQNDGYTWDSISEDKVGCIFKQRFVYTDVEQEKDENDKPTGCFLVHGYVVTYSTIETITFILESRDVANNLKKKVKPYTAMDVYGLVKMKTSVEEVVVEDDGWGDQTFANKVSAPARRQFVIVRIDKDSFDSSEYSEKSIADAIKLVKASQEVDKTYEAKQENKEDSWSTDIGDDDDWGSDEDDLPF